MPPTTSGVPTAVLQFLAGLKASGVPPAVLQLLASLNPPLLLAIIAILSTADSTANTDFLFREKFRALDPESQVEARKRILSLLASKKSGGHKSIEVEIDAILSELGRGGDLNRSVRNQNQNFNIGFKKIDDRHFEVVLVRPSDNAIIVEFRVTADTLDVAIDEFKRIYPIILSKAQERVNRLVGRIIIAGEENFTFTEEDLKRWREWEEAHPDVAYEVLFAARGNSDAEVIAALMALMRGAPGQDVVARLRNNGSGGAGLPPSIPFIATGEHDDRNPLDYPYSGIDGSAVQELNDSLRILKNARGYDEVFKELTAEQLRRVFPEGGYVPSRFIALLDKWRAEYGGSIADKAFVAMVQQNPTQLRVLFNAKSAGLTWDYPKHLNSSEKLVSDLLKLAGQLDPVFASPEVGRDFLRFEVAFNGRVVVSLVAARDHNRASAEPSHVVGVQSRVPRLDLPPSDLDSVDPHDTVIVLKAHGYLHYIEPSNLDAANRVVEEISRQRKLGRTVEAIVLCSCSQRDPRPRGLGWSNGYHFQKIINQILSEKQLPNIVVFTAADPGILYAPSLKNISVLSKDGSKQGTNWRPASPPSTVEQVSALFHTLKWVIFSLATGGGGVAGVSHWSSGSAPNPTLLIGEDEEAFVLRNSRVYLAALVEALSSADSSREVKSQASESLALIAQELASILIAADQDRGSNQAHLAQSLVIELAHQLGLRERGWDGRPETFVTAVKVELHRRQTGSATQNK